MIYRDTLVCQPRPHKTKPWTQSLTLPEGFSSVLELKDPGNSRNSSFGSTFPKILFFLALFNFPFSVDSDRVSIALSHPVPLHPAQNTHGGRLRSSKVIMAIEVLFRLTGCRVSPVVLKSSDSLAVKPFGRITAQRLRQSSFETSTSTIILYGMTILIIGGRDATSS
jgi:hypothetical protein